MECMLRDLLLTYVDETVYSSFCRKYFTEISQKRLISTRLTNDWPLLQSIYISASPLLRHTDMNVKKRHWSRNDRNIILTLAFILKFHRVSHKLQAPTRSTTTAVNLHICVATNAAYRYERRAKVIDQNSILNWNEKSQKQCTLL